MLQDIPRSLQESGLQEAAVRQLTSCTPLLTSGRLLGIGGLANCTVSTVVIGLLVDFLFLPVASSLFWVQSGVFSSLLHLVFNCWALVRQLASCAPLLTSRRLLGIGGLANCTVSIVDQPTGFPGRDHPTGTATGSAAGRFP